MKKIIITSALALMSMSAFADTSIPDVKGQMKVTANVAAGCDLSAENINFGVLQMPLSHQSASANINVMCSKGATVKLDILFQGASGASGQYTVVSTYDSSGRYQTIYKNGVPFSSSDTKDIVCLSQAGDKLGGYIRFYTPEAMGLFNVQSSTSSDVKDVWNICQTNGYFNNTALSDLLNSWGSISEGILKGVSSGEQIKYSLSHPDNEQNKWSAGSEGYTLVATGVEQLVPMKANIETTNNPTHRITPDTYVDTLTVQLSY